jgi:uncharacterized phage-associated protein
MVSILDIAAAFLTKEKMTHKKLQKLCYYAMAWHLVLFEERLIIGRFEAWIHGPVNPILYQRYRGYGWDKIDKEDSFPSNIAESEDLVELVNQVYRIYGELTGDGLEILTHSEKPWQEAREGLKPWESSNNIINEDTMIGFYREQLDGEEYA